ncbi:hypothetical protein V8E53_010655 [Lactarius tabidus]
MWILVTAETDRRAHQSPENTGRTVNLRIVEGALTMWRPICSSGSGLAGVPAVAALDIEESLEELEPASHPGLGVFSASARDTRPLAKPAGALEDVRDFPLACIRGSTRKEPEGEKPNSGVDRVFSLYKPSTTKEHTMHKLDCRRVFEIVIARAGREVNQKLEDLGGPDSQHAAGWAQKHQRQGVRELGDGDTANISPPVISALNQRMVTHLEALRCQNVSDPQMFLLAGISHNVSSRGTLESYGAKQTSVSPMRNLLFLRQKYQFDEVDAT